MYIFMLFILLLMFTIFIFLIYKKDILDPSLVFSLSFLVLSFMACLNAKKWQLGLHMNTFLVILLGVIEFFCVGYIAKLLFKRKKAPAKNKLKEIKINKWLEYVFLTFIIIFNVIFLYYIVKEVGNSFNSISTIIESINQYNHLIKFSDKFNTVKLPFFISNGRMFIVGSGYWFMYVAINNFIAEKKIKIQEVLIVLFAIIASMLTGSRTESFFMVLSGVVFYLCILSKKTGFVSNFNKKTVKNIGIVIIVMLALFIPMASLLGRKTDKAPFEYISIYCGAQVKNLDIFLQNRNNMTKNKIWGSQTFNGLIKTYGEKVGFTGYVPYKLDLPFQRINKHDLGNVYTTFYPYIYDFGYFGEFIMVFIMSFISHFVYEIIKRKKISKNCNIWILSYGIILSALAMSFFSNKFYEHIFSTTFIKYILTWVVLNYVLCEMKFKKRVDRHG